MTWRMPYSEKFLTAHYGETSEFRRIRGLQPHSGTDWARPRGTRIPAIANGTIQLIEFSKALGWVVVQSALDKAGKVWFLGYCHMDSKPDLEVGQKVKAGQTIAQIGNTGVSSAPHLHATASRKLRGVFGATRDKVDLYKLIKENA